MSCLLASDKQTISRVMVNTPCLLGGVAVITDGSNAATLTVYDSEDETTVGRKAVWSNTDAGASNYGGIIFVVPVKMERGIYVVVSGTGAGFRIYEYKH
jgi:hypothetical protein